MPRIGTSEELAAAAFALSEEQTAIDQVFEIQNRFFVADIKERVAADLAKLDAAKREELRKSTLSRKQNEAVEQRLAELRNAATITIAARTQSMLNKEK